MAFDFDMPNIAGNYVVNIKDFFEPTLLKLLGLVWELSPASYQNDVRTQVGTMSWRMTPHLPQRSRHGEFVFVERPCCRLRFGL